MSLRTSRQTLANAAIFVGLVLAFCVDFAVAQISDSLDSFPPRWSVAASDCDAEVTQHTSRPSGGVGDTGCESIQLRCGHGTEAVVEYRIEPTRIVDELTATAFVRSNSTGQRIGLRVRYPYLMDPEKRQSVTTIVYGADYRDTGQWQRIGIGAIQSPLRLKSIAIRRQFGADANLDDAFVDAIVINAYTGAGVTQVAIDNVVVNGMIPVTTPLVTKPQVAGRLPMQGAALPMQSAGGDIVVPALPPGRLTRILQHNGEPLNWVRTLGFDAVLVNKPVTQALLREAAVARVMIYAPPPSSPDIALESLLEPLAGYYLGTSMNQSSIESAKATADRLKRFPVRWQRGIGLAPAESWRDYAAISDWVVHDMPPPVRGLAADEEIASLVDRTSRLGRSIPMVVGIQSDEPENLNTQVDAIARSIGAPRGDDVPWHAMQLQVARAIHIAPRGILFWSTRSLTSGSPKDQRRSIALSYFNRYLEAIGPVVVNCEPGQSVSCRGANYRCSELRFRGGTLLIASSIAQRQSMVLAGEGDSIRIALPPAGAIQMAWRLTHFAAERLTAQTDSTGSFLEIVAPDTVETIILSGDAEMGGRIAGVVRRVATQAAMDRWQLLRETQNQLTSDWQAATGSRLISADAASINLLNAADATLRDAEPAFRSGDPASAMRMVRRADAWQMRSRWNLHAALSPGGNWTAMTSIPPLMDSGGVPVHLMWAPLLGERGWGENRIVAGSLDDASMIGPGGWAITSRNETLASSRFHVDTRQRIEGDGCLVAEVASITGDALPGGYAGTMMQIRSPSVRFDTGVPVRIDAKIRTLGFGGPNQGVLVYDTIGGAELGVLVRAAPSWQPIRLYRQTISASEVAVMFEAIGAGEVMIDDVQIRSWEPAADQPLPLRRLAEQPDDANTRR